RGARSRTHEGTGIGLALVQELVKLHGGTIDVHSQVDHGTRVVVTIPAGAAHLPADRIDATRTRASTSASASAFVGEVLSWLPESGAAAGATLTTVDALALPSAAQQSLPARIVLADDNGDMRQYVHRLLAESFDVEAVDDGLQALEACRRRKPDLVVSDVMMPSLDGFGLLAALRADPETRTLPVILLSARAGEEATTEGLAAGASDYLVKPFSARELMARVRAQLEIARAQQLVKRNSENERRRLHSFLMQAPAGIAILRGPELVFELANELYYRIVGKRDVLGKPGRVALPELGTQGVWDIFDQIYRTGEPFAAHEFPVQLDRRGDGVLAPGWFNWFAQPTYDAAGAIEGVMLFAIDVTEQVLMRRDVEEGRKVEQVLRQSAEQANRAKDEFLAMLGHELRNPLAPILTALQLMRLRGDESLRRERTVIERHVHHVVRLVDDLLDVSRITRGKVDLKKERLELAEIVAKAIEMTSPLMEERRHTLVVDVPKRGLAIDGDQVRLAQVVSNLLNNAAKYSEPNGRIAVTGAREGDEVVLSVHDNGVGMPPEVVPRVFDLFMQEWQGVDRSQGGLGLGLAIVRSLVQLHGGSVTAHSDGRGQGSELVVRLPAAAVARERERPSVPVRDESAAATDGLRVLVVDDNSDAADLLADCLRAMGHVAAVAYDGPQALQLTAQFAPEVALLDIGLPVMDGYELATHLRAQRPGLLLIALTGYGQDGDRERTRSSGFAAHLVKPINLDEVGRLLDRIAGDGQRRLPA
ncbi:MAG: two-component hybrid sensor and regulator, partial [bacterium]|nr:two-component hybrid sensor and regulator [bacterium]